MKQIIIDGGKTLNGEISISGMKNAAVALIPASILCDEEVEITNVPNISDKKALINIIELLNGKVTEKDHTLYLNTSTIESKTIPENLASKLRASYYFMGALLGRKRKVEIYFPGGCNIGNRKIDFHLKGFQLLGATISMENDKYIIEANQLKGTSIHLDFPSVGATINLMLAAVKAEGTTLIQNAAKEPEISNVGELLNKMGAKISGLGTNTIKIEGVNYLHKASIKVLPDRIEAGTYLIVGALIGEHLKIKNIIKEHLEALLSKLQSAGVPMEIYDDYICISKAKNLSPINIKTLVYPGFVTDWGQPITVLLTQCNGKSILEETIYENRMAEVPFLNKMGAKIEVEGQTAWINGPTPLIGTDVEATDLRAGASLVIAGLIATGKTTIKHVEYILRGYERIVEKLTNVGASIQLIDIE